MVDAASFIGCYYSYGGRLPPSGSLYYSKPCLQSGQRQYPWLGYKQEDTNSTLVHSQLPTLIISHMCHSRYVICTNNHHSFLNYIFLNTIIYIYISIGLSEINYVDKCLCYYHSVLVLKRGCLVASCSSAVLLVVFVFFFL